MKDEIKQALEEATPGEWVYAGSHGFIGVQEDGLKITRFICRTVSAHGYASTTDADRKLIINAPTWLKWQNERIEQLEKALNEITELGWSERFGGGYQYMGEYHAEAIKIARQALGKEE